MKNPPHPGLSVRINCLEPLGLSVTEGAKALCVSRTTLSRLLNAGAGISADMAIRLEKAGWSNADHWLRLQAAYDLALAQARQHENDYQGQALRTAADAVETEDPKLTVQRSVEFLHSFLAKQYSAPNVRT